MNKEVRICEKANLTLEEASAYFGIGVNKLREVTDNNNKLLLWVGKKRLIKRRLMEEYLEHEFSV